MVIAAAMSLFAPSRSFVCTLGLMAIRLVHDIFFVGFDFVIKQALVRVCTRNVAISMTFLIGSIANI